ncbi:TaqI-like C-terminal specificity domain-containing protein [Haloarcula marismortui]
MVEVLTGVSKSGSNTGSRLVNQSRWLNNENYAVSIISDPNEANVWWNIRECDYTLGDIAHIRQCIKTGNNEKYLKTSDEDPGKPWKPVLTGSDIKRYSINWPKRYLKYGDWLARNWKNQDFYEREKVTIRETSDRITAAIDAQNRYLLSTLYSVYYKSEYQGDLSYLLGIINSNLAQFFMYHLVFSTNEGAFTKARTNHYEQLPIPVSKKSSESHAFECEEISSQVEDIQSYKEKKQKLNLALRDHLGSYSDGPTLADVGLTQPPEDSADSILQQTTEQKPNLRVGEASVVRESDSTVEIQLSARYKPDDEDAYETDQWGYTETEPLPALRITDLTEMEGDLIEAFVPVAVDEAGGFAGFRETATKTNSLVDRLRKLTLPAVDDIRDGLASYMETVERADELEAKIERTDELIDEIVYELYGLTDEEIEIVEEAVGGE